MLPIDIKHDPATGEWSVVTGEQRLHVFKALRWPDCDAWWQSVRRQCPDEAEQLRGEDVRREFNGMVERIQSGCYCDDCRAAMSSRRALGRALEARHAPVSICVEERAAPLAAYGPKLARTLPPLTYEQTRRRYMDSGTIADKEAMVACVTETVPDLERLGRDWEPAAPELSATASAPARPRPVRRLASIGAIAAPVLGAAAVFGGVQALTAVVVSMLIGFALVIAAGL